MMAGMLPTALSIGQGSEFRQPMAIAVIGGLITSTVLSLVLVPVVYEFVDDFERWLLPRLSGLATPRTRGRAHSDAIHAPLVATRFTQTAIHADNRRTPDNVVSG